MKHVLRCQCGTLTGEIDQPHKAVRGVCYCKDCQSYAHFLGKADRVLDRLGGTDIVATQSRYVIFTSGTHALACLSLSPHGLLRWYAKCCNTPIANTPRNWRLPYVGVVRTCLGDAQSVDASFTPVQMYLNVQSAKGKTPQAPSGKAAVLLRFAPALLLGRVLGTYRRTPFFNADGSPVVQPRVLTKAERAQARNAI
jgi:hypothetical protein